MTTQYEAARIAHAELLASSLERAKDDAIILRDTVRNHLRVALPATFTLDVQDKKNGYNGEPERSLVVRAEDGTHYTLRFLCVQTGKYRTSGYIASISGETYERDGRRHCPNFEPRKDKTYNLKALTDDVQRAIERRRYDQAREKAVRSAYEKSTATFEKLGMKPSYPGSLMSAHDAGVFRVTVSAGNYGSGAVRVQVQLKDEYVTDPEQVKAMIAKLESFR